MKSLLLQTLTIIGLLVLSMQSMAQNRYVESYPQGAWYLGINGGAAWQQSDICAMPGWGAGLTLGKNIYHKDGGLIDFDVRARYLHTRTFGADHYASYGLSKNSALNGEVGPNYANNTGYAFLNQRTKINELSLEAVITANRLRENTGILLAGYGGIGLDFHRTKIDQLDANGVAYDYSGIDSTGKRFAVLSDLRDLRDGTYETGADGYEGTKVSIMPAAGVELGYQVTPNFAVGLGHKVTWSMDDILDGQQYNRYNDATTDNNDCYHYSNLFLRWRINGSASGSTDSETIYNNPTPTPGGTVNTGPAPEITITTPRGNPHNTSKPSANIIASIENVKSKKDIRFKLNGRAANFNFNTSTGKLASVVGLQQGRNTVEIVATNDYGSDTKGKTIVFSQSPGPYNPSPTPTNPPTTNPTPTPTPTPVVRKPDVHIVYPSANPHQSQTNRAKVQATIKNITSKNQIRFKVNGRTSNNFSFNPSNRSFTANLNLAQGSTKVEIAASNQAGSDSDSRTLIYKSAPTPGEGPVVKITDPSTRTATTTNSTATIKASIQNVSSKNNLTFTVKGVRSTNFSYNPSNGAFSANISLAKGNNAIVLKGANSFGTDSDSRTIVRNAELEVEEKPTVTINTPRQNPYDSKTANTSLQATLKGITKKSQIAFTLNGKAFTNFNFYAGTNSITANVPLNAGVNTIVIKVTNTAGSDKDDRTISYHPVTTQKPTVIINTPRKNPYDSPTIRTAVQATVTGITEKSEIDFTVNGKAFTNFNFNAGTNSITANVSLNAGINTVVIKVTNSDGSDKDERTISYHPVTENKPEVVITKPIKDPFYTQKTTEQIIATIKHIKEKRQISLTVNGKSQSSFVFNPSNGSFSANVPIGNGNNPVVVKATNSAGSDSDSRTIIYHKQESKPVVTIITPSNDPYSTLDESTSIKANVKNISNKSQITFTVNNRSITNFSFNPSSALFSANINLSVGTNAVKITATNSGGNASDTRSIKRGSVPTGHAPVVTIVNPKSSGITVSNAAFDFVGTVKFVDDRNQVQVRQNGQLVRGFTYNPVTQKVSSSIRLVPGENTLLINATNDFGSNFKQVVVKLKTSSLEDTSDPRSQQGVQIPGTDGTPSGSVPVPILHVPKGGGKTAKPTVKITKPLNFVFTSTPTYSLKALIGNAPDKKYITVKVNGNSVSTFTMDPKTSTLIARVQLKPGKNTVSVEAKNNLGTASENAVIAFSPEKGKPVIIMLDGGKGLSAVRTPSKKIQAAVVNVSSKSQIAVRVNGKAVSDFNYSPKSKILTVVAALKQGANTVEIIVGLTKQSITVTKR